MTVYDDDPVWPYRPYDDPETRYRAIVGLTNVSNRYGWIPRCRLPVRRSLLASGFCPA